MSNSFHPLLAFATGDGALDMPAEVHLLLTLRRGERTPQSRGSGPSTCQRLFTQWCSELCHARFLTDAFCFERSLR